MNLNDAINVIESASGFTDETTSVGEAWAIVLASLNPALAPVPVSERPWEREGWCDEQGQCWVGDPGGGGFIPSWRLCRPEDAPNMKVSLPFNALPLPSSSSTHLEIGDE